MEIEVLRIRGGGGWAFEGTHLADHGECGREGGVWGVEGEVEDWGGIDEVVDGSESVDALMGSVWTCCLRPRDG